MTYLLIYTSPVESWVRFEYHQVPHVQEPCPESFFTYKKEEENPSKREKNLCMKWDQTYFGGLLVCEDLWVDSIELQDEFIY